VNTTIPPAPDPQALRIDKLLQILKLADRLKSAQLWAAGDEPAAIADIIPSGHIFLAYAYVPKSMGALVAVFLKAKISDDRAVTIDTGWEGGTLLGIQIG
jgi:hypothetical protein